MTHLIEVVDGQKWTKQNECVLCGRRISFESDWTAWAVLATCR